MTEVKVGQKYKPSGWWGVLSSLPEHVKITEIHAESDTVCYVPGIYGATGTDDAGISTWEDRWILIEDVPQAVSEDNQLSPNEDAVNHPSHYTSDPSGVECIQITRHRDFLIGSAFKYIWRAGLKSDSALEASDKEIEDIEKAIWYLNEKVRLLKERQSAM